MSDLKVPVVGIRGNSHFMMIEKIIWRLRTALTVG